MTTLVRDISPHQWQIPVDAPITDGTPRYPLYFQIDNEKIRVHEGLLTTTWIVERGVSGTRRVEHSAGAQLLRYYPSAAGPTPAKSGEDAPTESSGDHPHPYAATVHTHPAVPHEHAEYEHAHPYATNDHSHPAQPHDHDGEYEAPHAHPYAAAVHGHDTSHDHDAAYSGTAHTHNYAGTVHSHEELAGAVHQHEEAAHDHDADYSAAGHGHDLTHAHTAAEVGASASGHTHDYAAQHTGHIHSHTAAEVGAATTGHTHSYAATLHSHAIADTTGLQGALDGKSATSHTHTLQDADVPSTIARDAEVTSAIATHAATPHGGSAAPVYAVLANGATDMALATNDVVKVTPTANATYTTAVPAAGSQRRIIVLTSGTTSRTITFGAGFKPTATLATGTTSARVFVVTFVSDGTNLYEASRTAAMVA